MANNKGFDWKDVVVVRNNALRLVDGCSRHVGMYTCSNKAVSIFVYGFLCSIKGLKVMKPCKTSKWEIAFTGSFEPMQKAWFITSKSLCLTVDDDYGSVYFVNSPERFAMKYFGARKEDKLYQVSWHLTSSYGLVGAAIMSDNNICTQQVCSLKEFLSSYNAESIKAARKAVKMIEANFKKN